jgi:hypothetical protein
LFAVMCTATAVHAQLCPPGYYNPNGGLAAGEILCPVGTYSAAPGALLPTTCQVGYYQPLTGQSSQIAAQAGFYVDISGAGAQIPAPAGAYVAGTAASTFTLCLPGYYTPSPGLSAPIPATPGHFVSISGATSQTNASPGSYVAGTAATFQTQASPGYYVPVAGALSQTPASVGYFVHFTGQSAQTLDPVGTTTPHTASTSPRSASLGSPRGSNFIVGPIYSATPTPTIDLTSGPNPLVVTNISTDLGTADTLTALTLLSATLSGSEPGDFQINGFVPSTVLLELGTTNINLAVVNPGSLTPGLHTATLTVQTDQSADYGATGQAFSYIVAYNAVPEPASLGLLGGVLALAGRRSRKH